MAHAPDANLLDNLSDHRSGQVETKIYLDRKGSGLMLTPTI